MRIRCVGRAITAALSLLVSVAAGIDAQAAGAKGTVTISYTMTRLFKIASNQLAVWIEDETGRYVRTLYATDFMARRRGWQRREQVCPVWVKAADIKSSPQEDIDAVRKGAIH